MNNMRIGVSTGALLILLSASGLRRPAALSAQETPPSSGTASSQDNPLTVTLSPSRPLHYRFVPAKSDLSFDLPTTLHLVHGKAGSWQGHVAVEPQEHGIVHSRIDIKADSLVTGSRGRDADMREKVLEVNRFPDIVFEGRGYRGNLSQFGPGKAVTVELVGDLTLHGVTRAVQTSVECNIFPDHVFVAGEVPLHWKEFGLRDMSKFFNRVQDPMTIFFRLWAEPEGSGH